MGRGQEDCKRQEVCWEILSDKNDREATTMILKQYGCNKQDWDNDNINRYANMEEGFLIAPSP